MQPVLASGASACDFTAAATTLRESNMRWGIVTAAVIAVTRSLWSLIVDRTISKHRGRPMRTRTVFSLALSLLPFAGGEAFAAERRGRARHRQFELHPCACARQSGQRRHGSERHARRSGLPGGRDAKQSRQHGNAPGESASSRRRHAMPMSRWCSMPVTGWRSTAPTT